MDRTEPNRRTFSLVLSDEMRSRLMRVAGRNGFLNISEFARMALREKCEELERKEAGA